jgi:hypothetical protein
MRESTVDGFGLASLLAPSAHLYLTAHTSFLRPRSFRAKVSTSCHCSRRRLSSFLTFQHHIWTSCHRFCNVSTLKRTLAMQELNSISTLGIAVTCCASPNIATLDLDVPSSQWEFIRLPFKWCVVVRVYPCWHCHPCLSLRRSHPCLSLRRRYLLVIYLFNPISELG